MNVSDICTIISYSSPLPLPQLRKWEVLLLICVAKNMFPLTPGPSLSPLWLFRIGRLPTFSVLLSLFQSLYCRSSIPGKSRSNVVAPFSSQHPLVDGMSTPARQKPWTPITPAITCSEGMVCLMVEASWKDQGLHQWHVHKERPPHWEKWTPSQSCSTEDYTMSKGHSLLSIKEWFYRKIKKHQ